MAEQLLRTDGIRGVDGARPLDPPTVADRRRHRQSMSSIDPRDWLVGRDTRESGSGSAGACARGRLAGRCDDLAGVIDPRRGVYHQNAHIDLGW